MEAFRLAVESGAGGLELDVHLTARRARRGDPRPYPGQDHERDRRRRRDDPRRAARARRRVQLQPRRRDHLSLPWPGPADTDAREVLREIPGVAVNIDMKADHPGIEAAVLGVLREAGAEGRALVVSSRLGAVRRFRRDVRGTRLYGGVQVGDGDFLPLQHPSPRAVSASRHTTRCRYRPGTGAYRS